MSEKETFEKLQTIVSNQLGIEKEKVVPSADFTKELGADSLDVVELVMAFEEEFEIEIDDEVAGEMSTVQDALNYILANKKLRVIKNVHHQWAQKNIKISKVKLH